MDGWYETGFIWKPNKDLLTDNKEESIARLKALRRRLVRDSKLFDTYEDIIRQQVEEGIIEKVEPTESHSKVFYMPHKSVIRQDAESIKMRVVYDASARATPPSMSTRATPTSLTAWKQAQHCKTCYGVSLFDKDFDQLYYVGTLKKFFSNLLSKKKIKMCFDSFGLITEI